MSEQERGSQIKLSGATNTTRHMAEGNDDPVGSARLTRRTSRRRAVISESFDIEKCDCSWGPAKIHPKQDDLRCKLQNMTREAVLFQHLDSEQVEDVLDAMEEKIVDRGQTVIKQGEDCDAFYVIESGTFNILTTTDTGSVGKSKLTDQGIFGELGLLHSTSNPSSVVAVTPGTLWTIDRHSFTSIIKNRNFKKGKMHEKFLESVPILSCLEKREAIDLTDALVPRTYCIDECIIKEGDEADGMYFVERGEVMVTVSNNRTETYFRRTLGVGAYFGEMALVENTTRTASVYAKGHVKLVFLERLSFERLLGPCLDIMKRNIKGYVRS